MITFFEKHNKLSWIITILGAILIFYLSSIPFAPGKFATSSRSIIYHFVAFFLLAGFLLISSLKGKINTKIFSLSFGLLILYGILDELHQFFVPGRFCTLFDVGIDTAGILLASGIYFFRLRFNSR